MTRLGSGSFWNLVAPLYDWARGLVLGRVYARMQAWALDRVPAGASVLELGAGTGALTTVLAPGCSRYVATDYSEGMLKILGRVPGVEVVRHDAQEPWPEPAAFDVVVIANLLHLLPEPERALTAAHQALRPGGLVLAPTVCFAETRLSAFVSALARLVGFPIRHRFSAVSLGALLQRCGFDVYRFDTVPGLFPVVLLKGRRPPAKAPEPERPDPQPAN